MKLNVFAFLFSLLMLFGLSLADSLRTKKPKAPGLDLLYSANITGGESVVIAGGPRGTRIISPILGGSFAGPRLKGTILPLGGDWALLDANNGTTLTPDVLQTSQTDDGEVIQVWETGRSQSQNEAYVTLNYETGSQKYYWINSVVAIGILNVAGNSLSVDVWQLTAP